MSRRINRHTNTVPSHQDHPITLSELQHLSLNKDLNDLSTTACLTIATFLFHSLGRISELLHSPIHAPLPLTALHTLATQGSDRKTRYKILLHRPKIKTSYDQWLSPVDSSIKHVPYTDPHIMMKYYLTLRSTQSRDSPALWLKSDGTPLTACEFKKSVADHLDVIIGESSCRSGGATTLAQQGVPLEDIQILGRWNSDAFRLYLRNHTSTIQSHISYERGNRALLEQIFVHLTTAASHQR